MEHQLHRFLLNGLLLIFMTGLFLPSVQAQAAQTAVVTADRAQSYNDAGNLPDDETLMEGYLEKTLEDPELFDEDEAAAAQAGSSSVSQASASVSSASAQAETSANAASYAALCSKQLSGQNLVFYNYMKKKIRAVASGKRVSTKFKIPVSAILGDTVFTEKELGITIYNEKTKKFGDMNKIGKKAYSLFKINVAKINYALQCDCPYELYWYDKTVGCVFIRPKVTCSSAHGGEIIFNTYFTVYMSVGKEFRSKTSKKCYKLEYSDGSVVRYYYYTQKSATAAPTQAAKNARDYVSACTSLTDYQKLLAYKNYICSQVTYDSDADPDNYGNPWQLVYVFDDDDSTNVVCEGYSKAFQYLCDLTDWESSKISCYSVTGLLKFGGDYESHMWNIVHMPDGYNYIADLTNSDEGAMGQKGGLFMKGSTSEAAKVTWVKYRVSGVTIKYIYNDETLALFKKSQLTMSDHAYPCTKGHTVVEDSFVWATKDQDGKTAGSHCSACGEVFKAQKTIYRPAEISCSVPVYNGKEKTPTVKVINSAGKVIDPEYYTVSYVTGTDVGRYKVEVSFCGSGDDTDASGFSTYRYAGSMSCRYSIVPKSTKLRSVKSYKTCFAVVWEKQTEQTDGYQLQYAQNRSFTKKCHTVTVSGNKKARYVVRNLKRKTVYYVRIRTYKTIGSRKIASKWSSRTKTVTR